MLRPITDDVSDAAIRLSVFTEIDEDDYDQDQNTTVTEIDYDKLHEDERQLAIDLARLRRKNELLQTELTYKYKNPENITHKRMGNLNLYRKKTSSLKNKATTGNTTTTSTTTTTTMSSKDSNQMDIKFPDISVYRLATDKFSRTTWKENTRCLFCSAVINKKQFCCDDYKTFVHEGKLIDTNRRIKKNSQPEEEKHDPTMELIFKHRGPFRKNDYCEKREIKGENTSKGEENKKSSKGGKKNGKNNGPQLPVIQTTGISTSRDMSKFFFRISDEGLDDNTVQEAVRILTYIEIKNEKNQFLEPLRRDVSSLSVSSFNNVQLSDDSSTGEVTGTNTDSGVDKLDADSSLMGIYNPTRKSSHFDGNNFNYKDNLLQTRSQLLSRETSRISILTKSPAVVNKGHIEKEKEILATKKLQVLYYDNKNIHRIDFNDQSSMIYYYNGAVAINKQPNMACVFSTDKPSILLAVLYITHFNNSILTIMNSEGKIKCLINNGEVKYIEKRHNRLPNKLAINPKPTSFRFKLNENISIILEKNQKITISFKHKKHSMTSITFTQKISKALKMPSLLSKHDLKRILIACKINELLEKIRILIAYPNSGCWQIDNVPKSLKLQTQIRKTEEIADQQKQLITEIKSLIATRKEMKKMKRVSKSKIFDKRLNKDAVNLRKSILTYMSLKNVLKL